jgi:hypothetical protein
MKVAESIADAVGPFYAVAGLSLRDEGPPVMSSPLPEIAEHGVIESGEGVPSGWGSPYGLSRIHRSPPGAALGGELIGPPGAPYICVFFESTSAPREITSSPVGWLVAFMSLVFHLRDVWGKDALKSEYLEPHP